MTPAKQFGRGGMVLLVTLVIVAALTLVVISLQFRSLAESKAAAVTAKTEQARTAAMSGIRTAIAVLGAAAEDPETWKDNPELFRARPVSVDGAGRGWYFTVYAPSGEEGEEVRYGAIDESGKLNVNVAGEDQLLALGSMNRDLVDCLLDWRDKDEEVRPYGAEREYYESLQPIAYMPRNGPLVSVEELLMVKGFSGSVIYGEDVNLNGLLDPNEEDGEDSFPADDGDSILDAGLLGLATAVSWEPNVDSTGEDRININGKPDDLKESLGGSGLPDETVDFIVICREEDVTFASPLQLWGMVHVLKENHQAYPGMVKGRRISSRVGDEELPVVLDRLTVRPPGLRGFAPGLVNVNTASRAVLATLPGIGEDAADRIIGARSSLDASRRNTPAWLYTEGILGREQFVEAYPYVTSRGFQYRVRSVGFHHPGGQFCVIEAVIDLARPSAGIFYLRDLTRLGMPVPLDVETREY